MLLPGNTFCDLAVIKKQVCCWNLDDTWRTFGDININTTSFGVGWLRDHCV